MKQACCDDRVVRISAEVIEFRASGNQTITEMLLARGYSVQLERIEDVVVLKAAWETNMRGIFFVAVSSQPLVFSIDEFIPSGGQWISVSFVPFCW